MSGVSAALPARPTESAVVGAFGGGSRLLPLRETARFLEPCLQTHSGATLEARSCCRPCERSRRPRLGEALFSSPKSGKLTRTPTFRGLVVPQPLRPLSPGPWVSGVGAHSDLLRLRGSLDFCFGGWHTRLSRTRVRGRGPGLRREPRPLRGGGLRGTQRPRDRRAPRRAGAVRPAVLKRGPPTGLRWLPAPSASETGFFVDGK